MRLYLLLSFTFLLFIVRLDAQLNMKVGYSYFRPQLTSLNSAFKAYNESNRNLIEGFKKTNAISYLDLGLRLKLGDIIGVEVGGKYGQSGINKATFASSSEKWALRASEINGGVAFYFKDFSLGGAVHRASIATTRNEPATKKYPVVDQTSYWAGSVHLQFEAESGKSSVSIRPYYQWAFDHFAFPKTAKLLGYKGSSEGNTPQGFGVTLLIYNGRR